MEINEQNVREIVASVVKGLNLNADEGPAATEAKSTEPIGGTGILPDIDQAIAAGPGNPPVVVTCNKVKGIRAALCYDIRSVVNSREHSHANVMTVGGPFHNNAELCEMMKGWLELRFSNGARWSTINKIMATERA